MTEYLFIPGSGLEGQSGFAAIRYLFEINIQSNYQDPLAMHLNISIIHWPDMIHKSLGMRGKRMSSGSLHIHRLMRD